MKINIVQVWQSQTNQNDRDGPGSVRFGTVCPCFYIFIFNF